MSDLDDLDQFEEDLLSLEDDPLGNEDLIPFVRQQAGYLMQHWHRSGGDPVYAVGSYYASGLDYPKADVVIEARESLAHDLGHPHRSWSEEDLRELELLIQYLDFELQHMPRKRLRKNTSGWTLAQKKAMIGADVLVENLGWAHLMGFVPRDSWKVRVEDDRGPQYDVIRTVYGRAIDWDASREAMG